MRELDAKSRKVINEYLELRERWKEGIKKRDQLFRKLKRQGYTYRQLAHYSKRSERRLKQIIRGR